MYKIAHSLFILTLGSVLVLLSACAYQNSTHVYYNTTSPRQLLAVPANGSEPKLLVNGAVATSLAFDSTTRTILVSYNETITERRLNGDQIRVLQRGSVPRQMAIDQKNRHLYWTARGKGKSRLPTIERCDLLDGGNRTTVIDSGVPLFNGIAIDSVRNKLYWTAGGFLWRSKMDGTDRKRIGPNTNRHHHIAVDAIRGRLFFVKEPFAPRGIWTANLDGTDAKPVCEIEAKFIESLAIDSYRGLLYWSERGGGILPRIRRCRLDGSEIKTVHEESNPKNYIQAITLGPKPEIGISEK